MPERPLLVEPTDFKEQVEYWLEGKQRIEAMNSPPDHGCRWSCGHWRTSESDAPA